MKTTYVRSQGLVLLMLAATVAQPFHMKLLERFTRTVQRKR